LLSSGQAQADRFLDAIDSQEKQILGDLHNGKIISAKPFGENGNMGSLWKVKVEHEGRVREAVFKPRPFGDRDGWARTPMEAAVYKLDRILGTNMVPPVAYRRNLNLGGNHFGEGAMILWVKGAHSIQGVPEHDWNPKREVFSSDLRIVQAISRDADNQNVHNILRAKNWKNGKWQLMKVDNEASMRNGAYVNLDHHLPTWGEVTRFNKKTFEKLKAMNFNDLKMDVGEFMSDGEIRQWLSTRDGLVKHIEGQAKIRGDVFFDESEVGFNAKKRIGKRATRAFRNKFDGKMKSKNVRVHYLAKSDPRLKGAQGRTVLTPKGVKVYLVKQPTKATLVEELVHVNQLRSMAKKAGGFSPLHAALTSDSSFAKLAPKSMEAYAKGRVASTLRGNARLKSKAEQARYKRSLKKAGVGRSATTLWRGPSKSRGKAVKAGPARAR
jgi:hypothetical protein